MSTTYFGTIATSGNGITIAPDTKHEKPKTPSGLIATQAVQIMDGWVGQVIVDKTIVFQTEPQSNPDDAIDAANKRVVTAIRSLFLQPQAEIEA